MAQRLYRIMTTEGMLSMLGYIISLRAVAFGLSFLFDTADAQRTVLYQSIDSIPVIEPETFGLLLVLSGIVTFLGYLLRTSRISRFLVRYGSYAQFFIYFFTAVLYVFQGFYEYALSAAAPWVLLVYVVSYAFWRIQTRESLEDFVRNELKRSRY
jgi:hypothetical protein